MTHLAAYGINGWELCTERLSKSGVYYCKLKRTIMDSDISGISQDAKRSLLEDFIQWHIEEKWSGRCPYAIDVEEYLKSCNCD